MELLKILSGISKETKTFSYEEIKVLYTICFKIAWGYIVKVHSDKFGSNNRWNDTIDDVASDSVVPLFVNNEQDTLHIINSYRNWNSKILTENDARFFISRLVWNRVEQRMAKVLKERDPVFNKIHKTLSNCIDGEKYKKLTFFGRVYFVSGSVDEIFSPVIGFDEFSELPSSIFYKKRGALLEEILKYITAQTIFFPAIPINILVNRIKAAYAAENNFSKNVIPQYESQIDLNQSVKECLDLLNEDLETKYLITNKLMENEYSLIRKTFHQISLDIKNGGMNGSLYSYMKEVDNSIERNVFYSNYHGIVNYLYKNFKNNIEERINIE